MIRFLTEVVASRKIKALEKIRNFDREVLSLKVKIKGPARKSYKIPKGIRGKTFTIERTCLKEWRIKKGNLIILNPEETRKCIKRLGKGIKEKNREDFTEKDIDGDGFPEILLDNPFIQGVVAPHYGARLLQIQNKGTGCNELYGGGYFERNGYIELGGIEETLSKQGNPDELWNALFKKERSKENGTITFSYKMKKEKGISIKKHFKSYKSLPGLLETCELTFSPKKTKGKKKEKKKKSIRFAQRIFFATGEKPDCNNLFLIPTKKKMNRIRFNKPFYLRPWGDGDIWWEWTHLHFSLDPGFIILERETSEDTLILFFNKNEIDYIWTGDKKRTPRLLVFYKEKKFESKIKKEYKTLFATANKFTYTKQEILFASRGKATGCNIPISFVYYSKRRKKHQSIEIERGGIIDKRKMEKVIVNGFPGSFFHLAIIEKKTLKDITCRLPNKDLKVRIKLD